MAHCMSCPQCAIFNAAGCVNKSPPNPIPVSQIIRVDIIDLLLTKSGNRHVVAFQDYLS